MNVVVPLFGITKAAGTAGLGWLNNNTCTVTTSVVCSGKYEWNWEFENFLNVKWYLGHVLTNKIEK